MSNSTKQNVAVRRANTNDRCRFHTGRKCCHNLFPRSSDKPGIYRPGGNDRQFRVNRQDSSVPRLGRDRPLGVLSPDRGWCNRVAQGSQNDRARRYCSPTSPEPASGLVGCILARGRRPSPLLAATECRHSSSMVAHHLTLHPPLTLLDRSIFSENAPRFLQFQADQCIR